jgi:hypothetical protein
MIIPLVGCSKKADTTTPKVVPLTPMQVLTNRANASDVVDARQDQNITDLSNRITTEIAAVSQVDLSPINARLGVLEALNFSDLAGGLSFLTVRVASLESYNISGRLAAIEARLNASPTATPNASATPTPIPTATPSVNCSLVLKPVAIYPELGNMSMVNGSILFRWVDSNASGYEFWFGTNPASLLKVDTLSKDALFYPFPATGSNTYYFWRVVAISPCGNQSTMWWFKTQ